MTDKRAKIKVKIVALILASLFLLPFLLKDTKANSSPEPNYKPDEVIVKFKTKKNIVSKATQEAKLPVSHIKKIDNNTFKINFSKKQNIKKIIKQYKEDPNIEYAEPNFLVYLTSTFPSDPYFEKQWGLHNTGQKGGRVDSDLDAPEAWDFGRGSSKVVIAIIDSGVDIDHLDLINRIWVNEHETALNGKDDDKNGYVDDRYGFDFIENVADPNPKLKGKISKEAVIHGTFVAGIASAQADNLEGIAGVSWYSKIMSLRVLDSQGRGTVADVVKAINYAKNNGAFIINTSFVTDSQSQALDEALAGAFEAGLVIVAAAGNEGVDLDYFSRYPICSDGNKNQIIGVAALDRYDMKPAWSNYSKNYIDVSAPGADVIGPVYYNPTRGFNNLYQEGLSGTSISSPYVAGLAALIKAKYPSWTNTKIRDRIIKMTDNIDFLNPQYAGKLGTGRINAYLALKTEAKLPQRIILGAGFGGGPHIRSFDREGNPTSLSFFAFAEYFRGGTRIATGDVDSDGVDEIVVGAGPGGGPHVRVFEKDGKYLMDFWPFHKDFSGGVDVACGDVDGDGIDEIGMSQYSGGQAWVKVYKFNIQRTILGEWNAFGNFEGGARIALGDIDKDGKAEVVLGAGQGGGPQVRVFEKDGTYKMDFWPFHKDFSGGVDVACGDVDNDGQDEIAMAQNSNGQAWIKVYRYNSQRTILSEWIAYARNVECGANVDMYDLDQDGKDEVLTGAGFGGGPHVRGFEASGLWTGLSFFAYDQAFRGGVSAVGGRF